MTRSIGRCDQQRVPSLYTERTVRQSGASQVRPSSKRGTGGPSSGDSVRTEVGSNSTDSCIGYLPLFGPFWLAVGYPRSTPPKRISVEVCRRPKRGTTEDGEERTERGKGHEEGERDASASMERKA